MNIAKLNASTGALIWEMAYGASSGAETVSFTSDGGFVVGGYINTLQPLSDINFKSGGQVSEATPFIGKISAADAAGSSTPASFEWTYTNTDAAYMGSAKALRIDASDNVFSIAGTNSAVIKLDNAGAESWATGTLDASVQINDIELSSDNGMVVAGHKYGKSFTGCAWGTWGSGCGTIIGHMMKLDSTGAIQWSKDYGNYPGGKNQFSGLKSGEDILVYNECWGVSSRYEGSSSTPVGYNLACGTGVEGCNWALDWWTFIQCYYDPRTQWRALTIATDLNGDRVWSRMDSYQTSESGTVASSAGEYVYPSSNGQIKIVTDETMGMGILTIQDHNGVLCGA